MKPINWQRILDSKGIEYVERGPNVKRGEINIRCPFCGTADPSHHMGLNLTSGFWACWRNQNHRGKSPLRLLIRLLGISYAKARELAGLEADYIDPEGFDAVAARIMLKQGFTKISEINHEREFLKFGKEFIPIEHRGRGRRCFEYLANNRKFGLLHTQCLCQLYYLMTATEGPFRDRIVIPYYLNQELVSWTGRAIADSHIRYRDLEVDLSLVAPKETLFNHDAGTCRGQALVVVEGPIDALKIDYFGMDWGVRAVGLSTNSIGDEQIFMLEELAPNFNKCLIMMDNKSQLGVVDSFKMKSRLSQIKNLGFIQTPSGYGDAGELPPHQAINFCRGIA